MTKFAAKSFPTSAILHIGEILLQNLYICPVTNWRRTAVEVLPPGHANDADHQPDIQLPLDKCFSTFGFEFCITSSLSGGPVPCEATENLHPTK